MVKLVGHDCWCAKVPVMLFVGFCSLLQFCVSPPHRHVPALRRSVPLKFWIVWTGPRVWIFNNPVVTDHARFGVPDEVVQVV